MLSSLREFFRLSSFLSPSESLLQHCVTFVTSRLVTMAFNVVANSGEVAIRETFSQKGTKCIVILYRIFFLRPSTTPNCKIFHQENPHVRDSPIQRNLGRWHSPRETRSAKYADIFSWSGREGRLQRPSRRRPVVVEGGHWPSERVKPASFSPVRQQIVCMKSRDPRVCVESE